MHCNFCNNYRKFKKTKISYIFLKKIKSLLFTVSAAINMKKYVKEKNQLKY